MDKILGFRQFLRSRGSFADLEKIIKGRNNYFHSNQQFLVIIAICGENPQRFLAEKKLDQEVELYLYSAWEENAEKVASVYSKSCKNLNKVQIIHYSEKPEGLTYPLELLINICKKLDHEHLAVCDSDFQFSYSEIRRAYDYHLSLNNSEPRITYPRRKKRSIDTQKYPINRLAMEDLENMYIYLLSDLNVLDQKIDFQSGISITNKYAHESFDFKNVGSWIGNLHMAIQVIHSNGKLDHEMEIETNIQNDSTINFDIQCQKINQLYEYYLIPLSNICFLASEHPDLFLMNDWTKNKPKEQIKEIVYGIHDKYNMYLKSNPVIPV